MKYSVCTDVGKKRNINEDYYLIKNINNVNIYIVCDGLGGYECGEVASKLTANYIYERLEYELNNIKINEKNITKLLKDLVNSANTYIFDLEKTDEKYKGMGTTLLLCIEFNNNIYYISIGDSSIYYIDKDYNISKITEDDTYVNTLLKTHAITYEESKNHPNKHMLTKAIGVFKTLDFKVEKLNKINGYILLCTDGVTNMIKSNDILNIFKENEFEDITSKIIDLANENGGYDNITALIVRV
ncbi:MAG: Stp1/IreP family PP2C-type Ser/Thr phosphatase [Clostridia bacterium]